MKNRTVKPAPGRSVRRLDTLQPLSADTPVSVPDTTYYRRLIRSGDLIEIDSRPAAKKTTKAQLTAAEKPAEKGAD